MRTSSCLAQVLRQARTNSSLLRSTYLALIILIGLYSPITLSADPDDQFAVACVVGLERTGGRGANAAAAYCGCMAKASGEFNGDSAGMLAVMEAPLESKGLVFRAQNDTNKKIISACVARIEEVHGVAAEKGAKKTAGMQNQPQGFWADSDVVVAIRD